jgi:GT2 family glycosyltransferase
LKAGCVIVTYNSARHLGDCLESCLRFAPSFEAGILVVDNASADGTRETAGRYPGVRLAANAVNAGFAAAVNQGFRELPDAGAVLVLNPDVVLLDSPAPLLAELEDPGVGAVSGLLVDEGGAPQAGFAVRRFPTPAALSFEILGLNRVWRSNPVNARYRCRDLDLSRSQEVEQPAGAFLLVRREAWRAAGGFDEGFYPIWFEDVDFLRRLSRLGWRIRHAGGVRARHAGGHAAGALPWAERQLYWYGSLVRYACLHFRRVGRIAVFLALCLSAPVRLAVSVLRHGPTRSVALYGKVMRSASALILAQGRKEESASGARRGGSGREAHR